MKSTLLAATMLCGLATAGQAATITVNTTFSGPPGDFNRDFRLPTFDTTLGVLSAAQVNVSGFVQARLNVQPNGTPSGQVAITPVVRVFAPGSGTQETSLPNRVVQASANLISDFVPFSLNVQLTLNNALDNAGAFLTLTALTRVPAGQNFSFSLAGDATTIRDGVLSTEFTYTPSTPVPEPASLALLSLGAFGVAVARRRVRQTA